MRRRALLALSALPLLPAPGWEAAWAQDRAQDRAQGWQPDRPVRMVVGFSPASTLDLMARALAAPLAKRLGQAVVVENRSGASGRTAVEYNSRATADGSVVGLSGTGPLAIDPVLQHYTLPPLTPITQVAVGPMAVVVRADSPAQSLEQLIALAKARPGALNFGSTGIGSTPHLAGELFCIRAGVRLLHVPYRGNADAMNDLLAGQVQVIFTGLPPVAGLIKGGKLRALAVMATERNPGLPEVPTTTEAGLPGAEASSIYGLFGPPDMDKAAVARLNAEVRGIVATPEFKDMLVSLGSTATTTTPEGYAQVLADDTAKWAAVIRAADITVK